MSNAGLKIASRRAAPQVEPDGETVGTRSFASLAAEVRSGLDFETGEKTPPGEGWVTFSELRLMIPELVECTLRKKVREWVKSGMMETFRGSKRSIGTSVPCQMYWYRRVKK